MMGAGTGSTEALFGPRIRSLSFSESVPLDWELHMYFLGVFSPWMGQKS